MPDRSRSVPAALVIGLDTPAGAYLARLLQARGQKVSGMAVAGPSRLAALGSQDDVTELDANPSDLHAADILYLVSQPDAASDALAEQAVALASAATRLVHVVDHALLLGHEPARRLAQTLARLRREAGRFAANAILHAHDSRLGPTDTLPAMLTLAAHRAAAGPDALPQLDIPDTPPRDWGWTPEYVDAVARLGSLPMATDIEVGSGVALSARDMGDHAARWFRLPPERLPLRFVPAAGQGTAPRAPDTERLKALLGWRATTTGADLMAALCEAAAMRAGNGP